jgi:hypothetical protein
MKLTVISDLHALQAAVVLKRDGDSPVAGSSGQFPHEYCTDLAATDHVKRLLPALAALPTREPTRRDPVVAVLAEYGPALALRPGPQVGELVVYRLAAFTPPELGDTAVENDRVSAGDG